MTHDVKRKADVVCSGRGRDYRSQSSPSGRNTSDPGAEVAFFACLVVFGVWVGKK